MLMFFNLFKLSRQFLLADRQVIEHLFAIFLQYVFTFAKKRVYKLPCILIQRVPVQNLLLFSQIFPAHFWAPAKIFLAKMITRHDIFEYLKPRLLKVLTLWILPMLLK